MLVSIIIPCYNVENYISSCLQSALAQTYEDIEIICVDNNSTDGTLRILLEYSTRYPSRIRVTEQFQKGASAARNKGVEISKGEWIQFLDADDLLLPEKIERQVKLILDNNNVSFIAAAFERKKINGNRIKVKIEESDPFKALFTSGLGITSANLFKADKVKEVAGWNISLKSSQEAELMFKLLKCKGEPQIDNTFHTLIQERETGQISRNDPRNNWMQYLELRIQIISYLKLHRPEYFETEKDYYYQKLFLQLKRIAEFDLEKAVDYFEKYIEPGFRPGINIFNGILLRFLGFKKYYRMKQILKLNQN
jgi:glycosyltransferase involved in cell wall biosynthesis